MTIVITPGGSSSGGGAATDTIYDAKGDVVAASAADTGARVAVGTNGQLLRADSSAAAGVGYGNPVGPSYKAGDFFGPAFITSGSQTLVAGTAYFIPLVVFRAQAVDRLAIWLRTVGATSTCRLGLYNDSAGRPSTLIQEATGGPLDTSITTGARTLTISQTLMPGAYWGCVQSEGGTPALDAASNSMPLGIKVDVTLPLGSNGFTYAHTGALAADVSAQTFTATGVPALVYLRAA